ncbi:hypothetical protein LR48_Vigan05g030000 [Vigna angularis]|uniref:Uncharacterized protein n=1 Tax=Phaseolus angularis TaxID=3914 RepID=A0A0L9UJ27_PHAAN|nr:hypothetical protein LR48_Vigan05g030000 [Vigna angularis]
MVGFQSDHKPGNKYNGNSNIIPDRVERLMRRRELFKSSKASLLNEAPDSNNNNNNNNNVITEYFEHDPRLREDNNSAASYERLLEGVAAAVRGEREDGKPFKQRLLVVANRLPVSAIRKGLTWQRVQSAAGIKPGLVDCHIY